MRTTLPFLPRTTLLLTTLLLAVVRPARAGMDFSLRHKTMVADAITVDNPYITDGESKIFLQVPNNWKTLGSAAALECVPEVTNSKVRLEAFPGSQVLSIDAAGGTTLLQQVTSQLPKEAQNVTALPVDLNPMPIFGWKTLEVTLRYEAFGQPMRRSVLYANMIPGRVLQLTVIAPDADFDKVHKAARHLLSSWFEPTRDLPPDLLRKYESPEPGGS